MGILLLNIKTLKFFFLWPKQNSGRGMNIFICFIHLTIIAVSAFQTIGALIYQITVDFEDSAVLSESLIAISDYIGFTFIYFCFQINVRQIQKKVRKFSDFLKYCSIEVIEEAEEEVRFYTTLFLMYFCIGLFINGLIPVLDFENCNNRRVSDYYRAHDPCGIPIRTWWPFDAREKAQYYFLVLLHANSCSNIACIVLCITMILIGFLIHINGQIKHLRKHLLNLFGEEYDETDKPEKPVLTLRNKIKFCIEYHIHIIDYTTEVFQCFETLLMVHVTLTSFVLGVLSYQVVSAENATDKLRYVLHLGGWVAMLFLTCYYGQIILSESTRIADSAYQSKWYNGPPSLRKYLCLIIMRSQKPLQLKAASLSVLSLATFLSVIKAAYSYFTLLLSFTQQPA